MCVCVRLMTALTCRKRRRWFLAKETSSRQASPRQFRAMSRMYGTSFWIDGSSCTERERERGGGGGGGERTCNNHATGRSGKSESTDISYTCTYDVPVHPP